MWIWENIHAYLQKSQFLDCILVYKLLFIGCAKLDGNNCSGGDALFTIIYRIQLVPRLYKNFMRVCAYKTEWGKSGSYCPAESVFLLNSATLDKDPQTLDKCIPIWWNGMKMDNGVNLKKNAQNTGQEARRNCCLETQFKGNAHSFM